MGRVAVIVLVNSSAQTAIRDRIRIHVASAVIERSVSSAGDIYLYILLHALVTQHVSHVPVVDLSPEKSSALEGSAVEITVQIPANCYSFDDLLDRSDSSIQQAIRQQLNWHR